MLNFKGKLLFVSEIAFSISFIAFSFVMFSCWFPTGFSATFSTLAFLFALPLFVQQFNWKHISSFEKIGLALFSWLSLSILWSENGIFDTLIHLFEYRLYFMIPVFAGALVGMQYTQNLAFYAALLGSSIALFVSYGLGFGWWHIEGASLSLGNRIFHGFIMSALLLAALLIAREKAGIFRVLAILIGLLTAYNVLSIEIGRTGYMQIISVTFIFLLLTFDRLKLTAINLAIVLAIGSIYLSDGRFTMRITETFADFERALVHDDFLTSVGSRLEFYRGATQIGLQNPVLGVGVGDVVAELQNAFDDGEIKVLTDNVHSEFLNMLVAGGVPALSLFAIFLLCIVKEGIRHRTVDRAAGDFLVGVSLMVFVAALFNSTVKDYGEKHSLMIMLSLLAAKLLADKKYSKVKPKN